MIIEILDRNASPPGAQPFSDYTFENAREILFREVDKQVYSYVYIDGGWVVAPCPGPLPRYFQEVMWRRHENQWCVVFKLLPAVWTNGNVPPFALAKIYPERSLFQLFLMWAQDCHEPRVVFQQVADGLRGLMAVDLCLACNDLEAEAQKVNEAIYCYWCAKERGIEAGVTWPAQHHSLRGKVPAAL